VSPEDTVVVVKGVVVSTANTTISTPPLPPHLRLLPLRPLLLVNSRRLRSESPEVDEAVVDDVATREAASTANITNTPPLRLHLKPPQLRPPLPVNSMKSISWNVSGRMLRSESPEVDEEVAADEATKVVANTASTTNTLLLPLPLRPHLQRPLPLVSSRMSKSESPEADEVVVDAVVDTSTASTTISTLLLLKLPQLRLPPLVSSMNST